MPDTVTQLSSTDLQGIWRGEVRFNAGPRAGGVDHETYLFADDGLLVHLRTRRGVGEWRCDGDRLSYFFYEVILDDGGKPSGVVHITARGTLSLDRSTFEVVGRGDVYGLDGELIATNHTVGRGWRADRPVT